MRILRRQDVRMGETLALLLHLVGAEQLRTQRRLIKGVPLLTDPVTQIAEKTNVTDFHLETYFIARQSVSQRIRAAWRTEENRLWGLVISAATAQARRFRIYFIVGQ